MLQDFGRGPSPGETYKRQFADAYDVAALRCAAGTAVAPRSGYDGEGEVDLDDDALRVRQGIARLLMGKLGYSEQELLALGRDVLRMQGVSSPFPWAALSGGESVLDLGSGFGIDVFLASMKVGERGRCA
eukprot:COSAG01_NODE_176_length_22957_cov_72.262096_21_plen_130_part_00